MKNETTRPPLSRWLWHPLLFALYPILALAAANLEWVQIGEIGRAISISLLTAVLLVLLLRLLLRSWSKAALLVSFYLFLFFSFGHLVIVIETLFSVHPFFAKRFLAALYAAVFIFVSWWVARILKRDISTLNYFLNVTAFVTLILPVYNLTLHTVRSMNQKPGPVPDIPIAQTAENPPDIYYLILDEYTRADIYQDIHGFDNSLFLEFLKQKGFYVAQESYSNYAQTTFSMASSLNMEYVNYMSDEIGRDSPDRHQMTPLIHNSRLRAFLDQQGYQFIAITSGWDQSEIRNADQYIWAGSGAFNEFEVKLIENTLPGNLWLTDFWDEVKRRKINYIFETLATMPQQQSPKFVFVHIFAPHIPLVFDAEGRPHSPGQIYGIQGIVAGGLDQALYSDEYQEETRYINQRLQEAISTILAESERPPVILIQGDHGSRTFLDWNSAENTCIHERMAILNAYYLPGVENAPLYPGISPVNSFRVVLNAYFKTELSLLDEEHYFALWNRPYDFIDVADRLEESCQALD